MNTDSLNFKSIFRFELMNHCWHADRDERPTFAHIVTELNDALHETVSTENSDIYVGIYLENTPQSPESYLLPVSNPDASKCHTSGDSHPVAPRALGEAIGQSPDTLLTPMYLTIEAWCDWRNSTLQWRHNGRDGVPNHQPYDCLLKHLFRHRWKKTSKLWVTGLCAGTSPITGEFPAQMASSTENVSIWWRHHERNDRKL